MTAQLFIYTALAAEAKPLISQLKLKKLTEITAYSNYQRENITLTVTGLGKNAMAAGIAYSQALFCNSGTSPVLLNIGIAGHKDATLGEIYLVDKCQDADNRKTVYPPIIFRPSCKTANLRTTSLPHLDYQLPMLYDMEASAFYETGYRFSTAELVHSLKIISDNRLATAENIQVQQVPLWIEQQLPVIDTVINELLKLADSTSGFNLSDYQLLTEQLHFTATEQIQLKSLLQRWQVITGQPSPDITPEQFKRGKNLLVWLNQQLDEMDFYL